jgi:hypothetical protein
MGEFNAILASTYGGEEFQLLDYSVKESAELKEGVKVGSVITVQGIGTVEAESAASLTTKIATVVASFRRSGVPLTITGLGGAVEYSLPLRGVTGGGPHVKDFDLLPIGNEPAFTRRFTFVVEWRGVPNAGNGSGDKPDDSYKLGTATRTDRLRQVTYRGELRGLNSGEYFRTTKLPSLRQNYNQQRWTVASEHTVNLDQDRCDYTVTFSELANPLPTGVPTAVIVDGEITTSQDMDAAGRMMRTISLDLQVQGDPLQLLAIIRPKEPPVILSERFEVTQIRETRLRASFTTLGGRFGNNLIEWEQSLSITTEAAGERVVFDYVGMVPEFGRKAVAYRATQRGRAVGAGRYLRQPELLFPVTMLERPPIVTFRPVDLVQRETTWSYDFVSATAFSVGTVLSQLDRPKDPDTKPGWY